MKRIVQLFSLTACLHGAAAWPGGTAVTNGRQVYNSPAGFSVAFGEPLSLTVISKVSFRISNEKLLQDGEQASQITFVVNQKKVASAEEVELLMAKEFPSKVLRSVAQPGATGFFWEERGSTTLKAQYDLLTSNGDFVEISVNANAAGEGIAWIAPIVRSLTYDVTPPVVHGLRTDGPEWEAGKTHKLYLKITDDYSGLKSLSSLRFDQIGADGKRLKDHPQFFVNEKPHAEGGDWYSLSYEVPAYLPEGIYVLSTIYASDRAENTLSYVADTQDPAISYRAFPQPYTGPLLPVLKVKVVNRSGKVDIDAPEFVGFRPDATVWQAGSTHRVRFKIRDQLAGFDNSPQASCLGQLSSTFEKDQTFFEMRAENCAMVPDGNDWYHVDYKVPVNQPAGRYGISYVRLQDNAKNMVNQWFGKEVKETEPGLVSSFFVSIANVNPEDITPPRILDWRVESDTWHPGETQMVHMKVEDDLSGLEVIRWLSFKSAAGSLDFRNPRLAKAEGAGWYAVPFTVDPYAKAGEYKVGGANVEDKIGNDASYTCENGVCAVKESHAWDKPARTENLPALSIRLVR